MAVIMMEKEGAVNMSFRSAGNFAVNEIAKEYFGGGGHKNAAGAKSKLSLEETLQKFLDLLPEYEEQLNQKN